MTFWISRCSGSRSGGPAPRNVADAFGMDVPDYTHRLGRAARYQLARIQRGVTSSERIYGLSALVALIEISAQRVMGVDQTWSTFAVDHVPSPSVGPNVPGPRHAHVASDRKVAFSSAHATYG